MHEIAMTIADMTAFRAAVIAAALVGGLAMPAGATADGNALYQNCASSDPVMKIGCYEYLLGVWDGLAVESHLLQKQVTICPAAAGSTSPVIGTQLQLIFLNFSVLTQNFSVEIGAM
jgi:hypothetical protein